MEIRKVVNNLSNDKWSSEIDQIYLDKANPYEIKCYHNRYHIAWEKAILPVLQHWQMSSSQALPFLVIDVATGSGAGASYIRERLESIRGISYEIIAIDINVNAIKYAKKYYSNSKIQFICGDMIDAMERVSPNVIVSMETLEHISFDTIHKFLGIGSDKLVPGGKAIFSSPRLRPRETTKKRPGHISEMYYQQFKYILGEYFPMVENYSIDRYGNITLDNADANLMLGICTKWNKTDVF